MVIKTWRRRYNQERPHSSLGYRTPLEYRAQWEREHKGKVVNAQLSLTRCAPPRYRSTKSKGLSSKGERQADTSSVADWALRSLSSVALSSQPTMESVP